MMLKCVSLAIYYHVKNRDYEVHLLEIFDEQLHPLSKDRVPENYSRLNPEHKHIYRFIKTLFSAAQLTSECAIITLVSITRRNKTNVVEFQYMCIIPKHHKTEQYIQPVICYNYYYCKEFSAGPN